MRRIIISIMFVFMFLPGLALATDVGGIISTDSTWDLLGSPYIITSEVQIPEGVTLTIEAGVEVYKGGENGWEITSWGSLIAVGTNQSNVVFDGVTLSTRDYNPSMVIEFASFAVGSQIYARNFQLRNSILQGTDVYIRGSNSYVEKNIFVDSRIIHQHPRGENIFVRNNAFYQPGGYHSILVGVDLNYTQPVIQYNTFHDYNITHFVLQSGWSGNCQATENYWDTTNPSVIENMIWDRKDDLTIGGYVIYEPYSTVPHPDTPVLEINEHPVANAGPDQEVDAGPTCNSLVTLDGSGSIDPDSIQGTNDDIVSFQWYEGAALLGSGETLDYTFGLGVHTVTLVVEDSEGATSDDEVIITVEDNTPPKVTAELVPLAKLKNEDKGEFRVQYGCSDNCDEDLTPTGAIQCTVSSGEKFKWKSGKGFSDLDVTSFELVVTCEDSAGNIGTATDMP